MPRFLADETAFDMVSATSAQTPAAAYTAWATALGVSSTATLQAMDADDAASPFTLQSPVLGTSLQAFFGSEGGVGFYRAPAPELGSARLVAAGGMRMHGFQPSYDWLLTFRPPGGDDLASGSVKLQRGGGVSILTGTLRALSGGATILSFAVRMSASAVTLVLRPSVAGTTFQVFGVFGSLGNGSALNLPLASAVSLQIDLSLLAYEPFVLKTQVSPAPVRLPTRAAAHVSEAQLVPPSVVLGVSTGHVPDFASGVLGKGVGHIYGTVQLKGEPANSPLRRRVRLVRERDGIQLREVWSDPVTGAYAFRYIDELQTWTVISYDHTRDKRAVIADGLVPELIDLP